MSEYKFIKGTEPLVIRRRDDKRTKLMMQGWHVTHNTHRLFIHHGLSFSDEPEFGVTRDRNLWRASYSGTGRFVAHGDTRESCTQRACEKIDSTDPLKLAELVITAMAEHADVEPTIFLPFNGPAEVYHVYDTEDSLYRGE